MTGLPDLARLFVAAPSSAATPIALRSGTLSAWNPATRENVVVLAGGGSLQNLPVLAASLASMTVGAAVALLDTGAGTVIIGSFLQPAA